ncbi:MAG: bifunctional 4-hydroxy-3-methylbut-2-enyl diphosphate reductase/30S ribosomal protein S1 [Ruminococcaceae bacterium]|nr:bifunctional 4-hydroxy-3-methylbut-2-enyl diphosphate reductase/30S ribosomal protein S1 [Oscillospiraceae bacterium]
MKITLAKTAGFCFGVDRAVNMVEKLLAEGKKVCTLGEIIHNRQLVDSLKERGVRIVSSPDEAMPDETLVIRSHGVARSVYEAAAARGVEVADATCPFVSKIHRIVSEAKGTVLIAGDPVHQEVLGIIGHTNTEYFVFANEEELNNLLENRKDLLEKDITVVSQTTFNKEIFEKCKKNLKKVYTNLSIFDTICSATADRQEEAAMLAANSDAMVVVGGKHSSNTAKLVDVCSKYCNNTVFTETKNGIDFSRLKGSERIGVVAGASTPAGIIKEVITTMEEILQPVEQAEEKEVVRKSFEEMTDEEAFEESLNSLNSDQKVKGEVLAVKPTEILVDIGRGLTGYIPADEYSYDSNIDLTTAVKVGDILDLIIMRTNDQEGTAMLSKRRYDAIAGWDKVVSAKESGEIITGTVTDVIKGGVMAATDGARIFIPASQATATRGESLEDLKGKEVSFRIIEIGRGRRAVGSIRSVLREQRKEQVSKLWETMAVGDKFNGVVKSITGYGAFVDIGGVDGMVHISELSWQRIKHPSEVVSVGDEIEVYIKALDAEKKKISLGYKKADENPWTILTQNYEEGSVVTVTVVSMTAYGAFARIIPGIDGLIHISQIANKHVAKPQDELTIGQEVEAKIVSIDTEKKRVSLSIRALLPEEEAAEVVETPAEEAVEAPAEEAPAEGAPAADAE